MKFDEVVEKVKGGKPRTLAVAVAQDTDVLEAVTAANRDGLTKPILVGDEAEIRRLAKEDGLSLGDMRIVNVEDPAEAVKEAVSMVSRGEADALMKGLVPTADIMRGVLNKEWGLAGGGVLSYVGVFECPGKDRMIFMTDPAIVMYPDIPQKIELVKNAVKVARGLGVETPKVALICAVEAVNPKMPPTLDATALAKMCERGQIKNCVIDGPLALDNALSLESAKHKGLKSPVAGLADILVLPNIESANVLIKAARYIGGCQTAGITMGARAPIVITSRSDDAKVKYYSIACALMISGRKDH